MTESTPPRIGFIGWNPFQLLQVRNLIRALPGACFVLDSRKQHVSAFEPRLLNDPSVPVRQLSSRQLVGLDGEFDILVCQTPFQGIQRFRKTRIAMLQYGYAKEAHNFAPWRALADLNLVYGPYAAEKIGYFSPTVAVGNPRYDDWADPAFHASARQRHGAGLDPGRRTVLYAPTWGEASSVDRYLGAVHALAAEHNVLVKLHHNTDLLEPARKAVMGHPGVRQLGANDDLLELLAVTDLLISDTSGAIFDAVFCARPVVLLDTDLSADGIKSDQHSLEVVRRQDLGDTVADPAQLGAVVARALASASAGASTGTEPQAQRRATLRSALFNSEPGATGRAVAALQALARGEHVLGQMQSYVRHEMVQLLEARAQLATPRRKHASLAGWWASRPGSTV